MAVLYVLVLLLAASDDAKRSRVVIWSSACAALTVMAFVLDSGSNLNVGAALRLGVSLAANFVTAGLLIRSRDIAAGLTDSEARYETVFNTLAVAIWEHDFTRVQAAIAEVRRNGCTDMRRYVAENPDFVIEARRMVRITDVNATALEMMGVATKQAFFSHLDMFLPETDESFADCIVAIDERRTVFQAETCVKALSGRRIDIIVAFGLGGDKPLDRVPGSILDIAEKKALQAQVVRTTAELAHAQRASALGAMSALIAHEINQPLTAIHSYSDAALRWMRRDQPNLEEVTAALIHLGEASRHARDVVQRVRSLVGKADMVSIPIDLNALLDETAVLVAREVADHEARIVLDLPPTPIAVQGDPILLKQVLVNLVVNALQAMEAVPPNQRVVTLSGLNGGTNAVIMVADQGPGWHEGSQESAFQTFFTTKEAGMGLGLSICQAAMDSLGGTILLRNGDERGAVVELTLPHASESKSRSARSHSHEVEVA
ncbi:sensor histidine kinase [Sphingomonas sp. R86521]|uniref:sensor histidine kinase n=1 Tax=Sphingomonas sp. R86521 TaxID=3093860 RepID=UPI0036D3970B